MVLQADEKHGHHSVERRACSQALAIVGFTAVFCDLRSLLFIDTTHTADTEWICEVGALPPETVVSALLFLPVDAKETWSQNLRAMLAC